MQGSITLKNMLEDMNKGNRFSIAFVTYNEQKKTGGEWIELDECYKHNHKTTQERKKELANTNPNTNKVVKNPNHYSNCTRNIVDNNTKRMYKIHIRLVRRYNNLIVL